MTFEQVKSSIQSGQPAPLYVFYGNEPYYIDELVTLAEQHILKPGEEAFNKTVFYGRDSKAEMILDQVRRFPVMAERQLVVVKEAQSLNDMAKLQSVFEKPVPSTVLVLVYKKEKLDKRFAVFKALDKNAVKFESKKLYENQVPVWLNGYLKSKKAKLSPRGIQLLIEYLGTDLEKLSNAVDKLLISSAGKEEVDDKLVEDTIGISRSYNVFELQEAIGQRNIGKVLKITTLMQGELKRNPLVMVISSLYNYLSKLYMIKPLGNDVAAVKKIIRIRSDFIVKKYISYARNFHTTELENMVHLLMEYDLKSKGVGMRELDDESLFRELILRLMK